MSDLPQQLDIAVSFPPTEVRAGSTVQAVSTVYLTRDVTAAAIELLENAESGLPSKVDKGSVGAESITSTGSAQARTIAARFGETANLLDYRLEADPDWELAFTRALATGKPVVVPASTTAYEVGAMPTIPSGGSIIGQGNPTIKATSNGRVLRAVGASQIFVSGVTFDGNKSVVATVGAAFLNNLTDSVFEDCHFINLSGQFTLQGASTGNQFSRCTWEAGASTALTLTGAGVSRNTIRGCRFHDNVGFGIWLTAGANRNHIEGNRCTLNGIELVGVTRDCWGNRIIGNHAEGSGDNGMSVSGYLNTVSSNICQSNAYTGIYVYGRLNTITGNICTNNGQASLVNGLQYAGVTIGGFFGGTGQNNCVTGNVIDDDQTAITQYDGIKIVPAAYVAWAAAADYAVGDYTTSGLNLYRASSAGTSGATAPVHTSGSVSDGGVVWEYIDTFLSSTREPAGNIVGPNRVVRFAGQSLNDGTINNSNLTLTADALKLFGSGGISVVTGPIHRRGLAWASGQAITYGAYRYNTVNRLYRCVNVGGSASVQPTHTSGTVTDTDGVAWRFVQAGQDIAHLGIGTSDLTLNSTLVIAPADGATAPQIHGGAGSPEAKVTAPVGSLYFRTDGGAGTTLYVKETGTGATGWAAK